MNPPKTTDLESIIQEVEAALGKEDLTKAKYQARIRLVRFFIGLVIPLILALLWLPTGWAVALRDALQGNAAWWRTWAVIVVFMLFSTLLGFPVAWYFDFYVENRLGTNRQSFRGWLWDQIKQATVGILIQSLLFLGVYTIFRLWPDTWFWGISALVVVFLGATYLLQPLLVRLQYKTEPLDDPELDARLKALFAKAGVRYAGVAVIKAGEKTARTNAALIPKGTGTQVVVFDTLLEATTPEGVEGVVAHELGHKVHRDLAKLMTLIGVMFIAALAVSYEVLQSVGHIWGLEGPTDVATFPLLDLIVAWLFAAMQVALNMYSRKVEYAADRFAVETTQRPDVFEEVLIMLAKDNKALPQPPVWVETLLHSHPSIAHRIQAIRKMAQQEQRG
ncbi:MAG: M48 family metallopeptidase [Chloroflexi bacterium]|nr:M48 family metallopeptidase [Chloroflexota bacterium]